jgi:hypothetical protein
MPCACSFLEAIELYRKANHHMEAAKLLVDLAKQSADKKVPCVHLSETSATPVHQHQVQLFYLLLTPLRTCHCQCVSRCIH